MPQNEADRIAQKRIEERKMREEDARSRQQKEYQVAVRSLLSQLKKEIQFTLDALKAANYPGIEVIYLRDTSFLGKLTHRIIQASGWKIGEITYDSSYDSQVRKDLYLVSNGRFVWGHNPTQSSYASIGEEYHLPNDTSEYDSTQEKDLKMLSNKLRLLRGTHQLHGSS